MLLLPTFNARLNPCPVGPEAFTPHAKGRYCGQCQRVVIDFTQAADPVAELTAARATSPDGRVCGSFRVSQVQAPTLSRRLKWFVLALVLIVGQGLTAQEAVAQVRKAGAGRQVKTKTKAKQATTQIIDEFTLNQLNQATVISGELPAEPAVVEASGGEEPPPGVIFTYAEQMPTAPGGRNVADLVAYIQKRLVWPKQAQYIEGRVFVNFTVGTDGQVTDAKILRGLHPTLDAEVLRVVRGLTELTPGRQNGKPVQVSINVLITFQAK